MYVVDVLIDSMDRKCNYCMFFLPHLIYVHTVVIKKNSVPYLKYGQPRIPDRRTTSKPVTVLFSRD